MAQLQRRGDLPERRARGMEPPHGAAEVRLLLSELKLQLRAALPRLQRVLEQPIVTRRHGRSLSSIDARRKFSLTRYRGIGFRVLNVRTGQLAQRVGVNLQTVRYYERRGLLPEPPRRESGYREYGPGSVEALRFIKRAQQLGFTLKEVEQLLHLASGGPDGCEDARTLADHRISDLETRIADLEAMRNSLERLLQTCERPNGERDCPLLGSLGPPHPA